MLQIANAYITCKFSNKAVNSIRKIAPWKIAFQKIAPNPNPNPNPNLNT